MTSKESFKVNCPIGYWQENIAPLGFIPDWQFKPIPKEDPNVFEITKLFGYDKNVFMERQYK